MEIIGKLKAKSDIKSFDNDFKIQEFYLDCQKFNPDTGEPIENLLKLQVTGNKISLLDNANKGDKIKVLFNIKGRLFVKKDGTGNGHVQNLEVWKIEKLNQVNKPELAIPPTPTSPMLSIDDDDLPF